jgi:hypothetical protein
MRVNFTRDQQQELRYQELKYATLEKLLSKEISCVKAIEKHYLETGKLPTYPEQFKDCRTILPPGLNSARFGQEVREDYTGGIKVYVEGSCDGDYVLTTITPDWCRSMHEQNREIFLPSKKGS